MIKKLSELLPGEVVFLKTFTPGIARYTYWPNHGDGTITCFLILSTICKSRKHGRKRCFLGVYQTDKGPLQIYDFDFDDLYDFVTNRVRRRTPQTG